MRQRKVIRTTLGELIAAVTDEVMPLIHDPSSLYMVVSCVLGDLEANYHLRRDPVVRSDRSPVGWPGWQRRSRRWCARVPRRSAGHENG